MAILSGTRSSRCVWIVLAAVLAAASLAQAEEFTRTLAVTQGTRLEVRLYGGTLTARGWDRHDVRVHASVFRADAIDVRSETGLLQVGARTVDGAPHPIDLQIDLPRWMAIDVRGTYLDITMEGVGANVTARTVRGDVRVRGGTAVSLATVEGDVVLEGARGRATLNAVNNGIRVTDLVGDLTAETVSGPVRLQRVRAGTITVGTGSGDISWDGVMAPQGRYQFTTHSGDVDVTLPNEPNVTVLVRPFEGRFRATFPLSLPDAATHGLPFTVTLGSGAARLELETFAGTISLRRQ